MNTSNEELHFSSIIKTKHYGTETAQLATEGIKKVALAIMNTSKQRILHHEYYNTY